MTTPSLAPDADPGPGWTARLAALRTGGWSVAVHNDYVQGGVLRTFWLLTRPGGRCAKGEAALDAEALAGCAPGLEPGGADPAAEAALARLRRAGWQVALHNDYRLGGVAHTFWRLCRPADRRYVDGEGLDDATALRACLAAAGLDPAVAEGPLRPGEWIGVDLDGTMAVHDVWRGIAHIGAPIPAMVARVKAWLAAGVDVRVFTARVDGGRIGLAMGDPGSAELADVDAVRRHIEAWCLEHVGQVLPITNVKDYGMRQVWAARAGQVEPNTGRTLAPEPEARDSAAAGAP